MKIGDHDNGNVYRSKDGDSTRAVCSCGAEFVDATSEGAQRQLHEHQAAHALHGDEGGKTL